MKLDLSSVSNARDLGGIATADNKHIAFGRLFRSGEHSRLSDVDKQTLLNLNLTRVIDLRTQSEIVNVPDKKIDGVRYDYISVIPSTTFGISYESADGETIARRLEEGIERMRQRDETPAKHMRDLYFRFVDNPYCREKISQFVHLLADNPLPGASLWHCSAGKDRVGVCTATLLHCLGVARNDIIADYMLTNRQTENSRLSVLGKVRPYVSQARLELVHQMLCVDESYIGTFFDTAEQQFGSFDGFVTAIGITEADKIKLKNNYLEN